jgi:hypothetical protein
MPVNKYGMQWPHDEKDRVGEFLMELHCMKQNHGMNEGGLGRYGHFRQAAQLAAPWVEWNPWSEKIVRTLCSRKTVIMTGCAAATKTFTTSLFGYIWWNAQPLGSSVVLTSTSAKMVRKRIWPIMQQIYRETKFRRGNIVDSKTTLQAVKGDDKNGIFAMAVREGPIEKALGNIKGVHNERMLVVIDEATDTPEAIFEAINNLQKGCKEFRLVVIANATSKLDPHGKLCEPLGGWNSISVDDDEWEIKGVPKWGVEKGICLHFDGERSPNVLLGEDKWPFIFTCKDLKKAQASEDARLHIGYWKDTRGFWAGEGVCNTVFSESLIDKFDGKGRHTFLRAKFTVAFCDFAFGGDECVFQSADIGDIGDGKLGIQLHVPLTIPILAQSSEPVHYQIARRCIKECEDRGVEPHRFAGDSTGEGGGVMSIISEEWSNRIVWVEFGGSPSEMPASNEDMRPSNEVYDRKVTEMHFSAREFLRASQLKGMNDPACVDLCAREYTEQKRKKRLDKKDEAKKILGHSPDHGDALVGVCELARRLGVIPKTGGVMQRATNWNDWAKKQNEVFSEVSYSEA